MPRDARAYLWDIQSAAEAIERFVAGVDADANAQSEVSSRGDRSCTLSRMLITQCDEGDQDALAQGTHRPD